MPFGVPIRNPGRFTYIRLIMQIFEFMDDSQQLADAGTKVYKYVVIRSWLRSGLSCCCCFGVQWRKHKKHSKE